MNSFVNGLLVSISQFALKFYVLFIFAFLSFIILTFRKRIDYLIMKKDPVWRKWYRGMYRCPACHKRLRPDDYPPNYLCRKCGNTYAFGDKDVREWIKAKPLITRGEFIRWMTLLTFLALGALWLFGSGVLAS
jgi:predicted RNA-binding Zn-ribbon protein involved in translation (DUF1610 family)